MTLFFFFSSFLMLLAGSRTRPSALLTVSRGQDPRVPGAVGALVCVFGVEVEDLQRNKMNGGSFNKAHQSIPAKRALNGWDRTAVADASHCTRTVRGGTRT